MHDRCKLYDLASYIYVIVSDRKRDGTLYAATVAIAAASPAICPCRNFLQYHIDIFLMKRINDFGNEFVIGFREPSQG